MADAARTQRLDSAMVLVDDHNGQVLAPQALADNTTDPAVADDDGMSARSAAMRPGQSREAFIAAPLEAGQNNRPCLQPIRDPIEAGEHEGVERDRQEGASENQVASIGRQEAEHYAK